MKYIEITLKSDLCPGNGTGFGYIIDNDICFDSYGFPYIPARRLKGLLREAAELLKAHSLIKEADVIALFGAKGGGKGGILQIRDAVLPDAQKWKAELSKENICADAVLNAYTSIRFQTELDENKCAKDDTLRATRVVNHYNRANSDGMCVETVFRAPVLCDGFGDDVIDKICKAVRHMGMDRNRGMGNVACSFCNDNCNEAATLDKIKQKLINELKSYSGEKATVRYFVHLDAPLDMPKTDGGSLTYVPGKTVIGYMAGRYLEKGSADDVFTSLFLNGDCCWSDLCISDGCNAYYPAPLYLSKLKYFNKDTESEYINIIADNSSDIYAKQPKSLTDKFVCRTTNGYAFISPSIGTESHHSRNQEVMLYVKSYLSANQILSGTVTFDIKLYEKVVGLLTNPNGFTFGHSANAQYAACSLIDAVVEEPKGKIKVAANEKLYLVAKSNAMLFSESGAPAIKVEDTANVLASELDLKDALTLIPDECNCLYDVYGGFNSLWRLQKPSCRVVKAGSVYAFKLGKSAELPADITVGDSRNEGLGMFEVISQSEMKQLTVIFKVDINNPENQAFAEFPKAFEEYDIQAQVYSTALSIYSKKDVALSVSSSFIGRVSLMLFESIKKDDFDKRLASIKDRKSLNAIRPLVDEAYTDVSKDFTMFKDVLTIVLSLIKYDLRREK